MSVADKAIILLSGGLDSTTTLAIAKSKGYECVGISFSYGQSHHFEVERAKELALSFQCIEHHLVEIPISSFGGSALTDPTQTIPDYQESNAIPITYVPARNIIFLSFAIGWAEAHGIEHIFMGVNAVDYSGYPDCRPEFIEAFQRMIDVGTKKGVEGQSIKIHTPLISMTKGEIINLGISLGVDYAKTVSCYKLSDDGHACRTCDSCVLRSKGFLEAGIDDPTTYIK